jgi:hypothetical protein
VAAPASMGEAGASEESWESSPFVLRGVPLVSSWPGCGSGPREVDAYRDLVEDDRNGDTVARRCRAGAMSLQRGRCDWPHGWR